MKFSVVKTTDEHMCRPKIRLPDKGGFYPSEASATWEDTYGVKRTAGSCLRQSFLRITGIADEVKLPPDPRSQWIFRLGKMVEVILVNEWKEMGIWVENNLKFFDAERNISGEIDCLIRDPDAGELVAAEVKSFYGYNATKELIGNKSVSPSPKTSQMMQLLIYLDQLKDLVAYGKLIYYARDSAARTEFDITIVEDAQTGLHRPAINNIIDYRFSMEDIYDRYNQLANYIAMNQLPPRDYFIEWDEKTVLQRQALGEIAKTTFEKWQKNKKNNPIGDWQCRYCSMVNYCNAQETQVKKAS